jgi:hypothetical protein
MMIKAYSFGFCLAAMMLVKTDGPCVSGLAPGQRTGPYSSIISTGPERGKSHCFICETGEKPAVIVFARSLSKDLGPLAIQINKALAKHKAADLRGWITFLKADQLKFDPQVVRWSQEHSLGLLPLGIFEDEGGPPAYRLNRDAEVTVLVCNKQKVAANFAFRSSELTSGRVAEIVKAIDEVTGKAK